MGEGICWAPALGLFCAVYDRDAVRVATSPDGINWTARTAASDLNWQSVCWSEELGLFVACAATVISPALMTSPDGITWTSRTPSALDYWRKVVWIPELYKFIACSIGVTTVNSIMVSAATLNTTDVDLPNQAGLFIKGRW